MGSASILEEHPVLEWRPKVLSLVQAETVTGPVKPLLLLARDEARRPCAGVAPLRLCATTRRLRGGKLGPSAFERAARAHGLSLEVMPEAFRFDPRVLVSLGKLVRRFRPDVIESHDSKSHFLVWFVLKMLPRSSKPRWVCFHHGYTRTSRAVLLYQQLDRLTLRQADHVVTLCRPFVDEVVARGADCRRVTVLTNFAEERPRPDEVELDSLRSELGIDSSDIVLLTIGRLSREKGHRDLLEAVRQLPDRVNGRRVRLIIVGDGPERQDLFERTATMQEKVLLVGFRPDAWHFYFISDLFVLPSHSEGSPLVVLETLAAGLPVVATEVGGVPELIKHGVTGLLVPPGSPVELRAAMLALLSDAVRRRQLGQDARDGAGEFSVDGYRAKLNQVYLHARVPAVVEKRMTASNERLE